MGLLDDLGSNTDRELLKMRAKTQQIVASKSVQQQPGQQQQQPGRFR